MRKLVMMACLGGAALAISARRGESSVVGEPPSDGHVSDSDCSISDGMGSIGGGSIGIKDKTEIGDGGSNGLNEGWTDVGDGGSGIIHDGGTKVIGDGGGACAGDGGSIG